MNLTKPTNLEDDPGATLPSTLNQDIQRTVGFKLKLDNNISGRAKWTILNNTIYDSCKSREEYLVKYFFQCEISYGTSNHTTDGKMDSSAADDYFKVVF